jgi:DNA replication ATP-dependent helicase Dna2
LDTDGIPALESRVGDLVQNEIETEIVRQIVEVFVQSGVQESNVGVITMYRQQIKIITEALASRPGVEVLTADRSQGRDKDCIIVSMVRSNEEGEVSQYPYI